MLKDDKDVILYPMAQSFYRPYKNNKDIILTCTLKETLFKRHLLVFIILQILHMVGSYGHFLGSNPTVVNMSLILFYPTIGLKEPSFF